MQRPEIRIIEDQKEEIRTVDVSRSESDYLLSKYGYKDPNQVENIQPDITKDLTFEEMIALQQRKDQEERNRRQQTNVGPNPITFDRRNVGYSETKFSDLDIDGQNLGIKVQIISDMPINNRR